MSTAIKDSIATVLFDSITYVAVCRITEPLPPEPSAHMLGVGSLYATGQRSLVGSAAMNGTGTQVASGALSSTNYVYMDGVGSLYAGGLRSLVGAASMSGTGTQAGSGLRSLVGSAGMDGTGTLVGSGNKALPGAAYMDGAGTLIGAGYRSLVGSGSMDGTGSIYASGLRSLVGSGSMDGTGTIYGSGTISGGGGTSDNGLDNVLDSVVFEVDVTLGESYSTSVDAQKWFNIIPSPADGETQSTYDFYLGATSASSTDDPTFNGTIATTSAYWSFDGGDFFTIAAGNTDWLETLHKTSAAGGGDFWISVFFKRSDSTWSNTIWTATANSGANGPGIAMRGTTQEKFALTQLNDEDTQNHEVSPIFSSKTNPNYMIASHNASANTTTLWESTTTGTNGSHNFQGGTTSAALDNAMTIGSGTDGSQKLSTECSLYQVAYGNEFLTDAKVSAMIVHMNTRHNRTY